MGLKPACKIEIGGQDVTRRFSDRLLSITVTDNSGETSDELELDLDDRDYLLEEPRRGAEMAVYLGYLGTPLQLVGRFVVDEAWPEGGQADILKIKAKAADMRSGLKAGRTRAWRDTTVGAIVAQIAGEHGLEPGCAAELADRAVAHRDQTNESDLHFLTRLGRDHGAVAAPKNGRLVFAPASSGLSASGEALSAVTLDRTDLIDWKGVAADRESYGKVRARWRDLGAAATRFAEAGEGEPVRTLRNTFPDEAAAQAAADAELARARRSSGGVELSLVGRPAIAAQTPIVLTGLRPSLNQRWIATTVVHAIDFSSGGFTTRITANQTGKTGEDV